MKNHSVLKEFLKYSSLNVLGMLGISFYILADTFFVANGIGYAGLAALNLAIPIYSFIHGLALMLGMGGGAKFSIFKSRNQHSEANSLFSQIILTGLFLSIVFILTAVLFSDKLAVLLGADSVTFEMTKTYLFVMLLFSPAFILNEIIICFVRNDGAPHLSMFAMVAGSVFNIIFDYIFIFPLKMGMLGAVLATGFSPVVSLMILSIHFIKGKNGFKFVKTKPKLSHIAGVFAIGFPSLVSELSSGIVMVIFNIIMLRLSGSTGVAAYGVVANISLVVIAIYTGIAQGTQPIVSKNYGCGNSKNLKSVLKYAYIASALISSILYSFMYIFADEVTSLFNNEKNIQLQSLAVNGIKLYFIACIFVGFNIISAVYFSSVEKPKPAGIISIFRGFIFIIPSAIVMSYLFGTTGLWLSFPITEVIVSLVSFVLIIYNRNPV